MKRFMSVLVVLILTITILPINAGGVSLVSEGGPVHDHDLVSRLDTYFNKKYNGECNIDGENLCVPASGGEYIQPDDIFLRYVTDMGITYKGAAIGSGDELIVGEPYVFNVKIDLPKWFENDKDVFVKPGDYHTVSFDLPNGVDFVGPKIPLEIKDGNDEVLAVIEFSQELNSKFEFKVTYKKIPDGVKRVKLDFNIDTLLLISDDLEVGDIEIDMPFFENGSVTINNKSQLSPDQAISKKGRINPDNHEQIIWDIEVNRDGLKHTDLELIDKLGEGQWFKSYSVYEASYKKDGTRLPFDKETQAEYHHTFNDSENISDLKINFSEIFKKDKNIPSDQGYYVEVISEFDYELYRPVDGNDDKNKFFRNDASQVDGDSVISTSDEVEVVYEDRLVKHKGVYHNEPNGQRLIDWNVDFNKGKEVLEKVTLIDHLPANTNLVRDTLIIVNSKGVELVEGPDYELILNKVDNTFTIHFANTVSDYLKISYSTDLNDDFDITDSQDFTNVIHHESFNSTGLINVGQSKILKEITGVNRNKQVADVKLTVNSDHRELNNLVISDKFNSKGLSLKEDSIQVYYNGTNLKRDTDWKLVLKDSKEEGFSLEFNENDKYNKPISVSFQVDYDIRMLDIADQGYFNGTFHNTASIDYVNSSNVIINSKSSAQFSPIDHERTNGFKDGLYNAVDKTIKWDVYTNFNNHQLVGAKLFDQLPTGLLIDETSIQYQFYTVDEKGAVILQQTPLSDAEIKEHILNVDISNYKLGDSIGQSITLDFVDSINHLDKDKQIMVSFVTDIVDDVVKKQYSNNVKYSNQNLQTSFSKDIDIKYGEELVNKSVEALEEDGYLTGILNWTVDINRSQSKVKNVVIEDTFTNNHKLLKDSVAIYGTTVLKDGTISIDKKTELVLNVDYELVINDPIQEGKPTFSIKLIGNYSNLEEALVLVYKSYLFSGDGTSDLDIKNSVSINGSTSSSDKVGGQGSAGFNFSGGGGSGSTRLSQVGLVKLDQYSQPVSGAKFKFTNKDYPEIILEGTTDENGIVVFENIAKGFYNVIELETPFGFQRINQEFEVGSGESGTVPVDTIINYRNTVNIQKKSSVSTLDLSGAEFGIFRSKTDQDPMYKVVTDSKGFAQFNRLVDDHGNDVSLNVDETYYIKELKALDGHILSTKLHEVTIKPFDYSTAFTNKKFDKESFDKLVSVHVEVITVTNYQGKAQIYKKDIKGNPIKNVNFGLYKKESDALVNEVRTDENGLALFENLRPGDYVLKELESEGFIIQSGILREFNIPEDDSDGKLFDEHKEPIMIELEEIINYKGSVTISKKDKENQPLSGAVFALLNENKEVIGTTTTSADGFVHFTNLSPGAYFLQETQAPEGFIKDDSLIGFVIDKKTSTGKHDITDLKDHINYKGSLSFNKFDGDTLDVISGAEFSLYDKPSDQLISTVSSDKKGHVLFSHLKPGSYYVRETKAAEDYILNTEFYHKFVIEDTSSSLQDIIIGDVFNYKGTLKITKQDHNAKFLEGTTFMITHEDGSKHTGITDEFGTILLTGLKPGSYTISETKASAGYIRELETQSFVIPESYSGAPVQVMSDWINYLGELQLVKSNVEGELLTGVEFTLVGPGHESGTVLTTVDGLIQISNLEIGKYTLVETKALPGYILNSNAIEFEVDESSVGKPELIELSAVNEKGSVVLTKTDAAGNRLEGVIFELFFNNESLGNYTTDMNGQLIIDSLAVGSYILSEVKAKNGFILNTQAIHFDIQESVEGEVKPVEIEYTNYKGSIILNKVDEQGQFIGGAEFELYDKDNKLVSVIVSDSGLSVIDNLAPGKYSLIETKAPKGYVKTDLVTEFEIEAEFKGEYEVQTIEIVNKKAPVLPSTGVNNYMSLYMLTSAVGFGLVLLSTYKKNRELNR